MNGPRVLVTFGALCVIPAIGGALLAPLASAGGTGAQLVEGGIVALVLMLGQLVGLRIFGRWITEKKRRERVAARVARIRAAAPGDPLESTL